MNELHHPKPCHLFAARLDPCLSNCEGQKQSCHQHPIHLQVLERRGREGTAHRVSDYLPTCVQGKLVHGELQTVSIHGGSINQSINRLKSPPHHAYPPSLSHASAMQQDDELRTAPAWRQTPSRSHNNKQRMNETTTTHNYSRNNLMNSIIHPQEIHIFSTSVCNLPYM